MSLLTQDDIQTIKSKSRYWDEIKTRETAAMLQSSELQGMCHQIGAGKILEIIKTYANQTVPVITIPKPQDQPLANPEE